MPPLLHLMIPLRVMLFIFSFFNDLDFKWTSSMEFIMSKEHVILDRYELKTSPKQAVGLLFHSLNLNPIHRQVLNVHRLMGEKLEHLYVQAQLRLSQLCYIPFSGISNVFYKRYMLPPWNKHIWSIMTANIVSYFGNTSIQIWTNLMESTFIFYIQ